MFGLLLVLLVSYNIICTKQSKQRCISHQFTLAWDLDGWRQAMVSCERLCDCRNPVSGRTNTQLSSLGLIGGL